jgi:hypothetical protein
VLELEHEHLVDGIQVQKVETVSHSKSGNVWIYSTGYTGYTRSPLTLNASADPLSRWTGCRMRVDIRAVSLAGQKISASASMCFAAQ